MGGDRALELRLLGPLEALRDGQAVALGGAKPRALLAVLALDLGRVVSVDRLVEALWPGDPPDSAGHAVQVYVSQLRKALGPVIATRPPGYVLELDRESVDLHMFSRLAVEAREALQAGSPETAEASLRDALALWRGPALADFAYEPFAQNEIARLEELRTAVLEERIEADLALGRHAELVSELEALVQAHPLRERPRRQLMLALYRSGRQADALAAYRAARETLLDELGLDPGPELKELEAAILRQDESLLLEETPLATPPMQFRRLVTILFCDVVESMALAAALDAEALGRVLQSYFETVSAAITRHGGAVEKYAGDAVMAAFGIPVSHEDDALRAVRAALDIRAGLAVLNERLLADFGVGIVVRLGLEAGEVVATPTDARQRLVTGEAVGIAAKLEQAAADDEIVVGEVAARLVDHAAHLEPLGELEIKGKQEPVYAYRLRELAPVGPAFESRLDASLVGRKRELAALRRALKRAVDSGSARAKVVVGPPGAGKSRLVAELSRRAKGATTLWGRCLSYGEGITYWPLREVLVDASESEERDAVLAGLDAETPPPAPEIAWLFRQFCEATAHERPLVLVLDDVHWAEPTLLELVEHVVAKAEASILVVCIAREELLEDRPDFLEGLPNADRIVLDALSAEETDVLLDGLGGTVLESDQRARILATAEGNPFFLEQLLALALEGGLGERQLPETVQALLAARLDRLGPGERAVLERGAVIGKEFRLDDVAALLDPEATPTAEVHMQTLSTRGFVRPADPGRFRFRHVLVQEAVYRAAPKRLRAELHERFIDRFESRPDWPGDLDEFAGYHLEQAYRLRTELGETDRRTKRIAEDGGRRLGDAGVLASKRGDAPAAVALLQRATDLLEAASSERADLLVELGMMLRSSGDLSRSRETLAIAGAEAGEVGDRKVELWALMESAYLANVQAPRTADDLLEVTEAAKPVFAAAADERLLGRAWLLSGWVLGGHRGQYRLRQEAAETAYAHYRNSAWPIAAAVGEIANALYYGPTPVVEGIERCEKLLRTDDLDRFGRANVEVHLGGHVAQTGDFDRALSLIASATGVFEALGQRTSGAVQSAIIQAEINELADDHDAAASRFLFVCDALTRSQGYGHLASCAGGLAGALYGVDRFDEALESTYVAEQHSAPDDVDARVLWMPVRAKVLARRGSFDEAAALVANALELAGLTDALNRRARARCDCAEALELAGMRAEAQAAYGAAFEDYEAKGNVVAAMRTRALLEDVVSA
jgi:DNA-binding SARP family transcriptional activator